MGWFMQVCGHKHDADKPCPLGWTWAQHKAKMAERYARLSDGLGPIAVADQTPLASQSDVTVRKPKTRMVDSKPERIKTARKIAKKADGREPRLKPENDPRLQVIAEALPAGDVVAVMAAILNFERDQRREAVRRYRAKQRAK